jgi:hypothetical protein
LAVAPSRIEMAVTSSVPLWKPVTAPSKAPHFSWFSECLSSLHRTTTSSPAPQATVSSSICPARSFELASTRMCGGNVCTLPRPPRPPRPLRPPRLPRPPRPRALPGCCFTGGTNDAKEKARRSQARDCHVKVLARSIHPSSSVLCGRVRLSKRLRTKMRHPSAWTAPLSFLHVDASLATL